MNKKVAGYWVFTALTAFAMLGGGFANASGSEEVQKSLASLGYPAYLGTLLGIWKIAAAIAILAPALPRLKEWAYAGITFAMTGAFFSHVASNDPVGKIVPPLVVLAIALASYLLRPASRRLDAPSELAVPSASRDAVSGGVPSQA